MVGIFYWMDILALACFITAWVGYATLANFQGESYNLVKVMHRYRLQWIKQMIKREDRLVDIRIIGNLLKTTTFLASTSVIIVAGVIAVMGYASDANVLLKDIPFASETPVYMWVIKSSLLLIIFIYSFFKLTWVIRQLNYASVLIMAAPQHKEGTNNLEEVKRVTKYVTKTAMILSNAGSHFNSAIRSYYYGLVATSWYISPFLFIILTFLVTMVLYRREFMSKTLILLS